MKTIRPSPSLFFFGHFRKEGEVLIDRGEGGVGDSAAMGWGVSNGTELVAFQTLWLDFWFHLSSFPTIFLRITKYP